MDREATGDPDAMTNGAGIFLRILKMGIGAFVVLVVTGGTVAPLYAGESDTRLLRFVLEPTPPEGGRFEFERQETRQRAITLSYPEGVLGRVYLWVNEQLVDDPPGFQPGGEAVVAVPLAPGMNQLNIQIRGWSAADPGADTVIWEYVVPVHFSGSVPEPIHVVKPYTEEETRVLLERLRDHDGAGKAGDLYRVDEIDPGGR